MEPWAGICFAAQCSMPPPEAKPQVSVYVPFCGCRVPEPIQERNGGGEEPDSLVNELKDTNAVEMSG